MLRTSNRPDVLVIEDNALITLDILDGLEECGVGKVAHASNMRDAIRTMHEGLPKVALVDLSLSDGDTGAQLAMALARSGVRVCIFSGAEMPDNKLASIPHVYIAKPAPADLVAQIIQSQLTLN